MTAVNKPTNLDEIGISPADALVTEADALAKASEDTLKVAEMRFYVAMEQAKMTMSNMSARNISRALTKALDLPFESGRSLKLVHKEEAELAALLAHMIDLGLIKRADNIKKQQAEEALNQTEGEKIYGQTDSSNSGS